MLHLNKKKHTIEFIKTSSAKMRQFWLSLNAAHLGLKQSVLSTYDGEHII